MSTEYAKSLDIDVNEVMAFLALQELAHARLFAAVPWLMPRFEALIGKYARGITIDLDAMEEQLRDAGAMDPESIAGAVNLTKVGIPGHSGAACRRMASLETLLALVEGWVDCRGRGAPAWRTFRISSSFVEMLRRERAIGGPAERTFESPAGHAAAPQAHARSGGPMGAASARSEGPEARDAKWSHPDLLPALAR